jgi:hypothetical protein
LDNKAQTLSYEHYYPYGGTAIIAGKDKTQVQQKRYRYTGKERDDSSGLFASIHRINFNLSCPVLSCPVLSGLCI